MPDRIDDYLIDLSEDKRIDYLNIHQFVMESSPEIVSEKKYQMPFYTCYGLLLYINFEKKVKQFYLGFCLGYVLDNYSNILKDGETKDIRKWYYSGIESLKHNQTDLKKLILESIKINRKKQLKQ